LPPPAWASPAPSTITQRRTLARTALHLATTFLLAICPAEIAWILWLRLS
jgi:hypothetical protein